MTQLVIDEVRSTHSLTQDVTLKRHGRTRIKYIRLHLMGYNSPSGDLRLRVLKDATSRGSVTQSVSDIETQVDADLGTAHAFWHGFVRFEFDSVLVFNESDVIELELTGVNGYTFSESAYIGWRKEHEDYTNELADEDSGTFEKPFAYQLWEWAKL